MARDDDEKRRRSFFPSIDSRFTGALEPSPRTGSYYNPARYANRGFSAQELSRIRRNLGNLYQQDLEYNRVANPGYQTIQDTGATSSAQFGSGRATPATVRNYINRYGSATSEGNVSFMTPSGGSISFTPQNRGQRVTPQQYLGTSPYVGGAQPTASPVSDITGPLDVATAYQKGYGAPSPTIQAGPGGNYVNQGGVMNPTGPTNPFTSFFSGVSNLYRGSQTALANIGTSLGKQFGIGNRPQVASTPNTFNPVMAGSNPLYPYSPRRYFDE